MKLMFVYGTLKQGSHNNIMLGKSKFLGRAVTKPKLNIKSVGIPIVMTPFSDAMRKTAKPIIGEVYKVSKKTINTVDILEGHPDLYKRFLIDVEVENKILEAYIYLFQSDNFTIEPNFEHTGTDCSITITEEGYEWVEVRCPDCGGELDVLGNDVGICYNCRKLVEL
jgi:gamma-glutamylaminecyclotransferase